MVTSGLYEPALGSFASLYVEQLVRHLEFRQQSCSSHCLTLRELFDEVKQLYDAETGLGVKKMLTNSSSSAAIVDPVLSSLQAASSKAREAEEKEQAAEIIRSRGGSPLSPTRGEVAVNKGGTNTTDGDARPPQQVNSSSASAAGLTASFSASSAGSTDGGASKNPELVIALSSNSTMSSSSASKAGLSSGSQIPRCTGPPPEILQRNKNPLSVGTLDCHGGMRTPTLSMEDVPITTLVNFLEKVTADVERESAERAEEQIPSSATTFTENQSVLHGTKSSRL
ncbi:unnamed protein product [Amoebophrya sp. A25]|nr:unnamed protein product [Amoebophrya sp. A25]|eukprot:GSA25T00018874001.1